MIANAQDKQKSCKQHQLPVKDGVCVASECQANCVKSVGAKGKSLCSGSKEKKSMHCHCLC